MLPAWVIIQRIAGLRKIHIIRQANRKLIIWHRHHAAIIAMDEGNGAAPIALARNTPIAQPPIHDTLTGAKLFQLINHASLRRRHAKPIKEARIIRNTIFRMCDVAHREACSIRARRQHHRGHGKPIFAREIKVALVMRGAAENRARAIFHQNEIRDPDRVFLPVEGMFYPKARIEAALFCLFDGGFRCAHAAAFGDELGCLGITRPSGSGQLMFGGNREEGHAKQRIRTRGKDFHFVDMRLRRAGLIQTLGQSPRIIRTAGAHRFRQLEPNLCPFTPPDPIGLHQLHAFRPAIQPAKRLQQIRREFRDAQEPLAKLLFLNQRARPPATAINHLFIGQHRAIHRVPIHPAFLALHQAGAPEIQQQFLLAPVIFHIASREFPRPIKR